MMNSLPRQKAGMNTLSVYKVATTFLHKFSMMNFELKALQKAKILIFYWMFQLKFNSDIKIETKLRTNILTIKRFGNSQKIS